MKKIEITPDYVLEKYGTIEDAIISITKTSIYFNASASKLLALKKDDGFEFVLIEEGNKTILHYKDSVKGFKIHILDDRGRARSLYKKWSIALHACLCTHFTPNRTYKFLVGDFKEGLWQLVPIEN